jgi:hypothetical protein
MRRAWSLPYFEGASGTFVVLKTAAYCCGSTISAMDGLEQPAHPAVRVEQARLTRHNARIEVRAMGTISGKEARGLCIDRR